MLQANSIISGDRSNIKPDTLEKNGDILSRVFRSFRNIFVFIAGLFGVTIGGGESITTTLTQAKQTTEQMHSIVAWAQSNAWIFLLLICVAFAVIFEYARNKRAQEYADGTLQGATPKTEV